MIRHRKPSAHISLNVVSTKRFLSVGMNNYLLRLDPPPAVRLMTMKDTLKSKGCAFLEFTHSNALLQGLKLHHSNLDGRQINVELTAGGGGKSAARINKLKQRNAQLGQQRVGLSFVCFIVEFDIIL